MSTFIFCNKDFILTLSNQSPWKADSCQITKELAALYGSPKTSAMLKKTVIRSYSEPA